MRVVLKLPSLSAWRQFAGYVTGRGDPNETQQCLCVCGEQSQEGQRSRASMQISEGREMHKESSRHLHENPLESSSLQCKIRCVRQPVKNDQKCKEEHMTPKTRKAHP